MTKIKVMIEFVMDLEDYIDVHEGDEVQWLIDEVLIPSNLEVRSKETGDELGSVERIEYQLRNLNL